MKAWILTIIAVGLLSSLSMAQDGSGAGDAVDAGAASIGRQLREGEDGSGEVGPEDQQKPPDGWLSRLVKGSILGKYTRGTTPIAPPAEP